MNAEASPARILLVDDHTIFRKGIRRLLQDEAAAFVIDEASNGAEAMNRIRAGDYQLVLLDLNLPGRSGLEWLKAMQSERPRLPVIVLSMFQAEQYAVTALRAGARGYVSKDMDCDQLLGAIRAVLRGGAYVPPEVAAQVVVALGDGHARPPHFSLTHRELQVLLGIVRGQSLTAIGNDLLLSVKTVSTYRTRVLSKLQLGSNAELVSYAIRHGLTV